jgi:hypothetical protein
MAGTRHKKKKMSDHENEIIAMQYGAHAKPNLHESTSIESLIQFNKTKRLASIFNILKELRA